MSPRAPREGRARSGAQRRGLTGSGASSEAAAPSGPARGQWRPAAPALGAVRGGERGARSPSVVSPGDLLGPGRGEPGGAGGRGGDPDVGGGPCGLCLLSRRNNGAVFRCRSAPRGFLFCKVRETVVCSQVAGVKREVRCASGL